MINISVKKAGTESIPTLIRRFSKKVQGAGIVRKVRGGRFYDRPLSKTKKRTSALRRIALSEKRAELQRLGLLKPSLPRRRR